MDRAWKRLRRLVWPESLFGRLTVAWVSAFFLDRNNLLSFHRKSVCARSNDDTGAGV